MSDFIMQMMPFFEEEEKKAVCEYMDENGFITEFKRTKQLEEMIADFTGAKHCVMVNNGTISLTLAALALEIGHGDEVIIPNYTMIATPNSMAMTGATPVFVDVEKDSLCLDLELTEKAITPKTKAIVLVLANGRYPSSGIESFKALASKHNLHIIEDSAQALGSYYPNGKHMGTVGEIGSFSFSAPKIISTGQGGALITNNDLLADKIRKLKDFGRQGGGNDIHDSIGFNFKFTELQACLGIEQVKKLKKRIKRKKEIYNLYLENLGNIPGLEFSTQDIENTVPWFFEIKTERRGELLAFMKEQNIGTRVMYPPINKQLAYSHLSQAKDSFPVSEMVGEKGLWIPSFIQLKDSEIERICNSIKAFYKRTK